MTGLPISGTGTRDLIPFSSIARNDNRFSLPDHVLERENGSFPASKPIFFTPTEKPGTRNMPYPRDPNG